MTSDENTQVLRRNSMSILYNINYEAQGVKLKPKTSKNMPHGTRSEEINKSS